MRLNPAANSKVAYFKKGLRGDLSNTVCLTTLSEIQYRKRSYVIQDLMNEAATAKEAVAGR
jgi:hypothetical protein